MKQYEKYKDSGIEWIGEIPEHWEVKKLKYEALIQPSNVDKKSNKDEKEVLLCNYMDVYKNEFIDLSINFMEATATEDEIRKFKIFKGDVLVTKDSETPDDIANPALVKDNIKNVICAYHLTQIRPTRKKLLGEYLFRLFQEHKFNGQFQVNANGVTRFGLSISSFFNAYIPLPTLHEQTAIAKYLDEKTAQIDKLISHKQKLIDLLREERTAIINQAVTKGIDPNIKLKPSGIEWLGEIPEHWEVKKLKYIMNSFDLQRVPISADRRNGDKIYDYYGASGVIDKVDDYLFDGEYILIGEDGANLLTRSTPLAFKATGKFWVNNHAHILKPKSGNLDFYTHLLESLDYTIWVTGSAQPKLTAENILNITICEPPINIQDQITAYISIESRKIDNTIAKIEKEIALLQEYRTALISEVVTGKIKVV
ncbi:MAG: restriction endonuclease subunit S [Candidatus Loosdrechtia sp.]|uniref:restriction endonuclease subunit S n=1 Tax=Candidatus Loosdrechtia sp. TaxID=3101272 RepID=UPI003A6192EE|nr:MAG: restriction endonuclease subunit S [Candidatus Jettenia sp. AMX2]